MALVHHRFAHPPESVFAAIADPWTYPEWLVGAREIRRVDAAWPEPGTKFHHRVGLVGPLTIPDSTKSVDPSCQDTPLCLSMIVRARPLGHGRVDISVRPHAGGSVVDMEERPLGALVALQPVLDPLTRARNEESLDRLASYLDEN